MIYLLCSTIRPKIFRTTHQDWISKADTPENIVTKVIVDTQWDVNELAEFDVALFEQDNCGITKPITRLTQSLENLEDDDIIIVMSDDFFPPQGWDTFLEKQFDGYSGGLSVYDGGPPNVQETIITIPIMDYATLKMLNKIVYHPAYTHMYSDNELYNNLVELDRLKIIDPKLGYTFEHRHWTRGSRKMDAQDGKLNSVANSVDKPTFLKRKNMTLEERLSYTPEIAPALSILICTIKGREKSLEHLMSLLKPQMTDEVEIIVACDDCEMTIGAKRNKLLKQATGRYIAFVDDDDEVSPNYVDYILRATRFKTDSIGIEGIVTINGTHPKKFIHSMKHKKWEEVNEIFLRSPNHCNPVKREIATKVGFNPNKSFEEDKEYSKNLLPHLRSEVHINKPIYKYLFSTKKKEYLR